MNENCKLAAVGDNCIDFYDQTGDAYPGGNPVNVAVYTVRLGGTASYTGVVGEDDYGALMRRAIAGKGVDVSHLRTEPGNTALSHVSIVDGDRVFGDYEEGVMASFRLTDEDIDFLCAHDLVVSGLWGMVAPDLPRLKAGGAKVAFDFADKPEDPVVAQALPFVDYAFFSNDADGDAALEDFLRGITAKGPRVAVVTRGEKGSLAYDGQPGGGHHGRRRQLHRRLPVRPHAGAGHPRLHGPGRPEQQRHPGLRRRLVRVAWQPVR